MDAKLCLIEQISYPFFHYLGHYT